MSNKTYYKTIWLSDLHIFSYGCKTDKLINFLNTVKCDKLLDIVFSDYFYKFSTIKGSVTVRWCGTSNGYYSTRVKFKKIENVLDINDLS